MRIATWNVARLAHKRALPEILFACEKVKADILVLTETDEQVHPSFRNLFQTQHLAENTQIQYKPTENRVSIFTNYNCVKQHPTYDSSSALCVELETESGNLCVYGTIMGIEGNRRASFKEDLRQQLLDFRRLTAEGRLLCIAGDFNISFSDNYCFTNYGREVLGQFFAENRMRLLTAGVPECIDHIAVSETFLKDACITITEWNLDKRLSDHKGIVAEILPR